MKRLKKTTKTLLSMIVALIFTLSLGVNVLAANETGSITINNDPKNTGTSMVGHTYKAYKILDMTKSGENYSYSVTEEFKNFFSEKNTNHLDLDRFAVEYIDSVNLTQLGEELNGYISGDTAAGGINPVASVTANSETVTISNLSIGYYLILDTTKDSPNTVIALAQLTNIDGDIRVELKASAPTIDKEIKHNENGQWGNVGDNQIGDDVEYRVITSVPDLTGYETYSYVMHDEMSTGLTFNNDIVVYIGDKDDQGVVLDEKYYTVTKESDQKFNVNINIIQANNDKLVKKGDKLYIYYSAKLNSNAVVANSSNDNTAKLEYSNNPYEESSKTETTPDTVKDYTFQLNVNKTDNDNNLLKGVEFELKKGEENIYFIKDGSKYIVCGENHKHGVEETCTKTLVSDENGKFNIVGLDDSCEYTLIETKPLDGYNPIDPIKFTITAIYNEDGLVSNISTDYSGITICEGQLNTTIINTSDKKLPETGGIGTTIFTVVGGILMVAGGAALYVKRRQNN